MSLPTDVHMRLNMDEPVGSFGTLTASQVERARQPFNDAKALPPLPHIPDFAEMEQRVADSLRLQGKFLTRGQTDLYRMAEVCGVPLNGSPTGRVSSSQPQTCRPVARDAVADKAHALEGRVCRQFMRCVLPKWMTDPVIHTEVVYTSGRTGSAILFHISAALPCNKTGMLNGRQGGRTWTITHDMSDKAITRTIFLAVKQYMLHELHEVFRVDGVPVFEFDHD